MKRRLREDIRQKIQQAMAAEAAARSGLPPQAFDQVLDALGSVRERITRSLLEVDACLSDRPESLAPPPIVVDHTKLTTRQVLAAIKSGGWGQFGPSFPFQIYASSRYGGLLHREEFKPDPDHHSFRITLTKEGERLLASPETT